MTPPSSRIAATATATAARLMPRRRGASASACWGTAGGPARGTPQAEQKVLPGAKEVPHPPHRSSSARDDPHWKQNRVAFSATAPQRGQGRDWGRGPPQRWQKRVPGTVAVPQRAQECVIRRTHHTAYRGRE